MKSKLTKVLLAILSLAICIGAVCIVASADGNVAKVGDTEYATLKEALDAAPEGGVVKLTADATLSDLYAVTKDLTIDLNGKTLDAPKGAFKLTVEGVDFTLKGEGTVNVTKYLIATGEQVKVNATIEGGNRPMKVNHTSPSTNVWTDAAILAYKGTLNVSNVDFTSSTLASFVFIDTGMHAKFNAASFNMTRVLTEEEKTTYKSHCYGVFEIRPTSNDISVEINASSFTTKGHAAFYVKGSASKAENLLTVKGSRIAVGYANQYSSLMTGAWGQIGSDVIFEDCIISYSQRTTHNTNANGSAIIFRNTIVDSNGGGGAAFFRSQNVRLEAGSALVTSHSQSATNNQIYTHSDNVANGLVIPAEDSYTGEAISGINLIISEGARFNEDVYNKLINVTGIKSDGKTGITYYALGIIAYADGSLPTDSNTYKIVYDPMGNPAAPYVVVKADVDEPTYNYINVNPTDWNRYNYSKGSTYAGKKDTPTDNIVGMFNKYWRYVPNGTKLPEGNPCFLFGLGKGSCIQETSADVIVMEFDIGTDSAAGFVDSEITIHARKTNQDGTDYSSGTVFKIAPDGTVNNSALTGGKNGARLSTDSWNHITFVIDTKPTGGAVYVYINGEYIGHKKAYKTDSAYLYGPRLNISGTGVLTKTGSVLVDNVIIKAYGDGSSEALSDNGMSYVVRSESINVIKSINSKITVGGNAYATVDEAIKAVNAIDLPATVQINGDINVLQTITVPGKVSTNGNSIALSLDSLGAKVTRDAEGNIALYEFDAKYTDKADFKFFVGDYTDPKSVADSANYKDGSVIIGQMPEDAYSGKAAARVVYNGYYKNYTQIGWAETPGATETFAEVTPEYAEAHKGESVTLWPVYDYSTGDIGSSAIVLNADGSFNRYFVSSSGSADKSGKWYGSGVAKYKLQPGETVVLQMDVIAQVENFNSMFDTSVTGDNKVYGFDLNGHTLTVDPNHQQTTLRGRVNLFQLKDDTTLNLYSSAEGGLLKIYGVNTSTKTTTATYTEGDANIPAAGTTVEGKVKTEITHSVADGKVTVTTTATTYSASGGIAVILKGANGSGDFDDFNNGEVTQQNIHANIGTVNVFGKTVPGSNLTISSAVLVDATGGDSTCSVNIDGVNAVRNTKDFPGLIVIRRFFGTVKVSNANLYNPIDDTILSLHAQGLEEVDGVVRETTAEVVLDNCHITALNDNEYIFNINSGKSVTVRNCTTNGRINWKSGTAKTKVVVVIEEGNTFVSYSGERAEDVLSVSWNRPMELAGGVKTISVPYYEIKDGNAYNKNDYDYIDREYVIAVPGFEGEADQVLPVLPYKSINKADAVVVTYKAPDGSVAGTQTYAPGALLKTIATPEEGKVGTALKLVNVAWNAKTGDVVEKSMDVTASYDVVASITGIKANLSIYTDFGVNVYIPASYRDAIVSVHGDGEALIPMATVNVGGVDYIKVTVNRAAKDAAADAVVTFAIKDSYAGVDYDTTASVTINVVSYAEKVLKTSSSDADKQLMYQMLTYANEAIKFRGGNANETITALIGENTVTEYNASEESVSTEALSAAFEGATVDTGEDLAFVFVLKNGFAGKVTVKNGEVTYTFKVDADDSRVIELSGMKVYNFAHNLEVSAEGTIGEAAVNAQGMYNLATFVKYHIDGAAAGNETSVACVEFAKAFYNYAKNAYDYVNAK